MLRKINGLIFFFPVKIEECFEDQITKTIGESTVFEILWRGGLPADECKYRFIGGGGAEGGSSMDKYRICVDVVSYLITDCNVALTFITLAGGKYIQTVSYIINGFADVLRDAPKRLYGTIIPIE